MRFLLILGLVFLLPHCNISPALLAQNGVSAGDAPTSRILFIFDASNSMAGQWDGERKIDMARNVLFEMLDTLEQIEQPGAGTKDLRSPKPGAPAGLQRYQTRGSFQCR